MGAKKGGERAVGRVVELVLMIAPESANLMCVGIPTLVGRLDEWVEKVADDEAACIGAKRLSGSSVYRPDAYLLLGRWWILLDSGWC